MNNATALILMDFAENYSFPTQDEAQRYHWQSWINYKCNCNWM